MRQRLLGVVATVVATAAVGAGALALLVLRRRLVVVTVAGQSMRPTYLSGDRVLVRRVSGDAVQRGQVVVFAEPDGHAVGPRGWMIKRVVAAPGDPFPRRLEPRLADRPEGQVPADRLVVLGDNPNGSYDSRTFGYVPGGQVLGVVVRRLAGSAAVR
jgi:signal peptidase I